MIEFAFAIPVFLVLIYYIHDLPKQKLIQRKMQFVAYEMSATLQNIAAQRSKESKKVTKADIINAIRLANLTIFPGVTQYSTNDGWHAMPLGYFMIVHIFCFVGSAPNKAELKWNFRLYPAGVGYTCRSNEIIDSTVDPRAETASAIHRNLQISKKGELKIVVEFSLYSDPEIFFASSKNSTRNISKRELFGFLFYNPVSTEPKRKFAYFTSVAIFTPVGTGFSEEAPQ